MAIHVLVEIPANLKICCLIDGALVAIEAAFVHDHLHLLVKDNYNQVSLLLLVCII